MVFILGEKNGIGLLILNNGTRYEGEFKNDKKNGDGELIFSDSAKYKGSFKDGFFNGYGWWINASN